MTASAGPGEDPPGRDGPSPGRARAVLDTALQVFAWWVVLGGLYVVFISTPTDLELIVAASVAVLLTTVAVVVRRLEDRHGGWRLRWARWLLPLPVALVADTASLAWLVVRKARSPRVGTFRRIEVPGDPTPARLALSIVLLSVTPGTYVVDESRDGTALLVHSLREKPSRLEKVMFR